MNKQTWKLKDKDRPKENSCPVVHFAERIVKDRKIQNHPQVFAALAETSGRRHTLTSSKHTSEETPSLHHCQIQRSTITNKAF
jgi:hypothetical protein